MDVGIFRNSASAEFKYIIDNFALGVARTDNVSMIINSNYKKCDIAVLFGSYKPRMGYKLPKKDEIRKLLGKDQHQTKRNVIDNHDGPIVIIETALLGRRPEVLENNYWRVGIGGFLLEDNQGNKTNFGFVDNQKSDRWDVMVKKLNIDLLPWKATNDGHILLVLQKPYDASLFGSDHLKWGDDICKELRKITDKPIVVRPHPLTIPKGDIAKTTEEIGSGLDNIIVSDCKTKSIVDDLVGASCVVSYTSGSSVDAIISGTPVVALHPGNLVYPISGHRLEDVNNPPKPDRMNHLYNLAYAQWTIEEMNLGLPWVYLNVSPKF